MELTIITTNDGQIHHLNEILLWLKSHDSFIVDNIITTKTSEHGYTSRIFSKEQ